MSEGPIKAWRDSWKPPVMSTNPKTSLHAPATFARAYCGRAAGPTSFAPEHAQVTCSDCLAALAADAEPADSNTRREEER